MGRILAAIFILILIFSSCSKTKVEDINPSKKGEKIDVDFSVKIPGLEKGIDTPQGNKVSAFERNSAPVYVSGLKIDATYTDSDADVVKKEFLFIDSNTGGDKLGMKVTIGTNLFEAISIPTFKAANTVFTNSVIKVDPSKNAEERNKLYSQELEKMQGVYTIYTSATREKISNESKNVELNMMTMGARYSVVLETSEVYDVDLEISYDGLVFKAEKCTSEKASAIVLNEADFVGEKEITVKLIIYDHITKSKLKEIDVNREYNAGRYYTSKIGFNTTLVLRYNKDKKLITQESGFTFIWADMKKDGEVVEIVN